LFCNWTLTPHGGSVDVNVSYKIYNNSVRNTYGLNISNMGNLNYSDIRFKWVLTDHNLNNTLGNDFVIANKTESFVLENGTLGERNVTRFKLDDDKKNFYEILFKEENETNPRLIGSQLFAANFTKDGLVQNLTNPKLVVQQFISSPTNVRFIASFGEFNISSKVVYDYIAGGDPADARANQILDSDEGETLGICVQSTGTAVNRSVASGTPIVVAFAVHESTDRVQASQKIEYREVGATTWISLTATSGGSGLTTNAVTSLTNGNALTSTEDVIAPDCGISTGATYIDGVEIENADAAWSQTRVRNDDFSETHVAVVDNGSLNGDTAFQFRWVQGAAELFVAKVQILYTVTVDTAPQSYTVTPKNNVNLSSSSVAFEVIPRDPEDTTGLNVSIYHNHTGGADVWAINGTNSSAFNASQTNFTVTMPDGKYIWNALVIDSAANQAFNTSNKTFTVDTISPVVSYASNTPVNLSNESSDTLTVNISSKDTNPINITWKLAYANATGTFNTSSYRLFDNVTNTTISWLSVPEGIFNYNVTVTDVANNQNTVETRRITLDQTVPVIRYN